MCADVGVPAVSFPKAVFENMMDEQLAKAIKPPAKKHLGRRLREVPPFLTALEVLQDQVSTARGLPEQNFQALIDRSEDGLLKPFKSTAVQDTYKLKLQNPTHLDAFYRLEERAPSRGMGAAKMHAAAPPSLPALPRP